MSKFYRNSKGIFHSLTRAGGLYYLVGGTVLVILCVAAFLIPSGEEGKEVSGNTDGSSAVSSAISDNANTDAFTDSVSSDPTDGVTSDTPSQDAMTPVEDVTMQIPVAGTVGTGFSLTVPVFSESMNDWRVHQGIDYLTEEPVPVVAAADGIVENVYISELMGHTVEIRHADGTISVYQSLSGEGEVIQGQEVKQGDVIGTTGLSADSECLVGNHLHFALIRDGVYLDPAERFTP